MADERLPGGIAVPDERLASGVSYTTHVLLELVWSGHPEMIGYHAFRAGQVVRVVSTELLVGDRDDGVPHATVKFIEVTDAP